MAGSPHVPADRVGRSCVEYISSTHEGHVWLSRKEHYDQLVMSVLGGRGGHTSMHAVHLPCVD